MAFGFWMLLQPNPRASNINEFREKLSRKLSDLIAQGFSDRGGAIVFTATNHIAEQVKPENFPDLTGFECFVNHIHIENQLDDQSALLKQGIAFALAIKSQLRSIFPDRRFKVIVASRR